MFKDFFIGLSVGLSVVIVLVVALIGAISGLIIANESWNCRTYSTVATTKMLGGTCFVQAPNGKWVTHNSYVKTDYLDIEVKSR